MNGEDFESFKCAEKLLQIYNNNLDELNYLQENVEDQMLYIDKSLTSSQQEHSRDLHGRIKKRIEVFVHSTLDLAQIINIIEL